MWSKLEFRKKFDENKIKLWENEQEIRAMTTYFIEMYSGLLDHFESHINVHWDQHQGVHGHSFRQARRVVRFLEDALGCWEVVWGGAAWTRPPQQFNTGGRDCEHYSSSRGGGGQGYVQGNWCLGPYVELHDCSAMWFPYFAGMRCQTHQWQARCSQVVRDDIPC